MRLNAVWPTLEIMKHLSRSNTTLFLLIVILCSLVPTFAQEGKVIRETLRGKSLENNVTGESLERGVSVYLPPRYESSPNKRYPVLYLLHGIGDNDENWTRAWSKGNEGYATIQDVMNRGITEKRFGEMIVVMPDQRTRAFGSFYVNSSATGNWDDFTSRELVDYIDKKYRTLAKAASRGIAGHSMGGFGAITLGMKHPETFSVVYGMNPALLGWSRDLSIENRTFIDALNAKSLDELFKTRNIFALGFITISQAISPNPAKPPFYADFPFEIKDGQLVPAEPAFSKWQEYSSANLVKKYQDNLRKLKGLKFDSGNRDEFLFIIDNSRELSETLAAYGIDHIFEEYNGDHRNRLWGKNGRLISDVLPFFWFNVEHQ